MSATVTRGVHHVGLTVPDLAETRQFFMKSLGFEQVGDVPHYPAVFLSDSKTLITLWQAEDAKNSIAFDRKNNIGLHHFALIVEGYGALEALYNRLLNTKNVVIEFPPEPLGNSSARHMITSIPGGIRLEFISPEG